LIKNFIFDLSEVLIKGIIGIGDKLTPHINQPAEVIDKSFWGTNLRELFIKNISEEEYLDNILKPNNWNVSHIILHEIIRKNFHFTYDENISLLNELSNKYPIYLLSDHGIEWIEYIHSRHNFFNVFKQQFYSYEFGSTKKEEKTFQHFLNSTKLKADECLFIDDNLKNVETAKRVGIKTIQYKDGDDLREAIFHFI
jgi:HAD superfamily hydrolase (TIGR01549 family)